MVAHAPQPDEPNNSEDGPLSDRGLTARQEQAIIALINEATVAKAAVSTGIPERTIYNWLEDPGGKFSRAYRDARRQSFSHAISLCAYYAPMAVQALAKILADPHAPHSSRVSAATNLLKTGREGIEMDDLVQRIESLEQAQNQAGKHRGLNRAS
jgi:hypothetical protein